MDFMIDIVELRKTSYFSKPKFPKKELQLSAVEDTSTHDTTLMLDI